MAAGDVLVGRRIRPALDTDFKPKIPDWWMDDLRAGDYCGPIFGYTGDKPSVFFLKPNARDSDAPIAARSIQHVSMPPHVFRECSDGSLEIRESIAEKKANERELSIGDGWHGYLDEGHRWRQV